MSDLHFRIVNAVTTFDRKQARKRGYNPHALGHYIRAAHQVDEAIAAGIAPREAIKANFIGRLLDCVLRACDMETASVSEHRHG